MASRGDMAAGSLGALHRLQRLRALLVTEGIDAICLIGGVDGRRAAGQGKLPPGGLASSALAGETLAWLLGGASGRELGAASTAELYEEAVLVLTATDVRLYLPRASWEAILPHLGMWPDLRLWLPPAGAEDDLEVLEEHKARSFVQMLCGVASLGVCLQAADAGAGAASTVESWPLIQARRAPPPRPFSRACDPQPVTSPHPHGLPPGLWALPVRGRRRRLLPHRPRAGAGAGRCDPPVA